MGNNDVNRVNIKVVQGGYYYTTNKDNNGKATGISIFNASGQKQDFSTFLEKYDLEYLGNGNFKKYDGKIKRKVQTKGWTVKEFAKWIIKQERNDGKEPTEHEITTRAQMIARENNLKMNEVITGKELTIPVTEEYQKRYYSQDKVGKDQIAKEIYDIADNNTDNISHIKFQMLFKKLNKNNVVDIINKYNADHKHDDSSIVDTIMAERSNKRKETMKILLKCLYQAAIDAGVPQNIAAKLHNEAIKEVAHQVYDNALVTADPQKIENCVDALMGEILKAKSKIKVSAGDEVEYIKGAAESNEKNVNNANDKYNAMKETIGLEGKAADGLLGLFGCKTMGEMEELLKGAGVDATNLVKIAKKIGKSGNKDNDIIEEFKTEFQKIFKIPFDAKTFALKDEVAAKLDIIHTHKMLMPAYEYLQKNMRSDIEDTSKFLDSIELTLIKGKFGDRANAIINTLAATIEAQGKSYTVEDYKDALELVINSLKTQYNTAIKGTSEKELEQQYGQLEQACWGTTNVGKTIATFNKNMQTTDMVAMMAGDILTTIALSAIPGGFAWLSMKWAAKAAKWGNKGAKVYKYLSKTQKFANATKKVSATISNAQKGQALLRSGKWTNRMVKYATNGLIGFSATSINRVTLGGKEYNEETFKAALFNGVFMAGGSFTGDLVKNSTKFVPKIAQWLAKTSGMKQETATKVAQEAINDALDMGVAAGASGLINGGYTTDQAFIDAVVIALMHRVGRMASKPKTKKPQTPNQPKSPEAPKAPKTKETTPKGQTSTESSKAIKESVDKALHGKKTDYKKVSEQYVHEKPTAEQHAQRQQELEEAFGVKAEPKAKSGAANGGFIDELNNATRLNKYQGRGGVLSNSEFQLMKNEVNALCKKATCPQDFDAIIAKLKGLNMNDKATLKLIQQINTRKAGFKPNSATPKAGQPKVEQPKTEQPKTEQPKTEQPEPVKTENGQPTKENQSKPKDLNNDETPFMKATKNPNDPTKIAPQRTVGKGPKGFSEKNFEGIKQDLKNRLDKITSADDPKLSELQERINAIYNRDQRRSLQQIFDNKKQALSNPVKKGAPEQPKVEEPKVEQPKVEQPKVEQPKVEQPKVEQPTTVTPECQNAIDNIKIRKDGNNLAPQNVQNQIDKAIASAKSKADFEAIAKKIDDILATDKPSQQIQQKVKELLKAKRDAVQAKIDGFAKPKVEQPKVEQPKVEQPTTVTPECQKAIDEIKIRKDGNNLAPQNVQNQIDKAIASAKSKADFEAIAKKIDDILATDKPSQQIQQKVKELLKAKRDAVQAKIDGFAKPKVEQSKVEPETPNEEPIVSDEAKQNPVNETRGLTPKMAQLYNSFKNRIANLKLTDNIANLRQSIINTFKNFPTHMKNLLNKLTAKIKELRSKNGEKYLAKEEKAQQKAIQESDARNEKWVQEQHAKQEQEYSDWWNKALDEKERANVTNENAGKTAKPIPQKTINKYINRINNCKNAEELRAIGKTLQRKGLLRDEIKEAYATKYKDANLPKTEKAQKLFNEHEELLAKEKELKNVSDDLLERNASPEEWAKYNKASKTNAQKLKENRLALEREGYVVENGKPKYEGKEKLHKERVEKLTKKYDELMKEKAGLEAEAKTLKVRDDANWKEHDAKVKANKKALNETKEALSKDGYTVKDGKVVKKSPVLNTEYTGTKSAVAATGAGLPLATAFGINRVMNNSDATINYNTYKPKLALDKLTVQKEVKEPTAKVKTPVVEVENPAEVKDENSVETQKTEVEEPVEEKVDDTTKVDDAKKAEEEAKAKAGELVKSADELLENPEGKISDEDLQKLKEQKEALERAIKDGKSPEEIQRLANKLQQTINDINNELKSNETTPGGTTQGDGNGAVTNNGGNNNNATSSRRAELARKVQKLVNKEDATEDEIKGMLRELRAEGRFMGRKQLRRALKDKRRAIRNKESQNEYQGKANDHLNKAERDLRKKEPEFRFNLDA